MTSALLGHADVGTTLNIYSHLLLGLGRQAADKLDPVLAPRRDTAQATHSKRQIG